MAPTPTKAVMEKSPMVRDVRPRIEDGRGNRRIDDFIAFNPAEKSDLSLVSSICWKNASCPVFGSRDSSLDLAFSAVRHSFSSATSLPATPTRSLIASKSLSDAYRRRKALQVAPPSLVHRAYVRLFPCITGICHFAFRVMPCGPGNILDLGCVAMGQFSLVVGTHRCLVPRLQLQPRCRCLGATLGQPQTPST